ncbi:glycoside hydrolase family 47 protein [Serendipita vermifera MAFF 305830]|uniref:alpha-1,2-Mannosidase n=1 Tax=Serendipita vermifera MAFF 305830 TaxID=933852 RepID=A0A0C2Y013_SERVB|nr:glycoside hydrolase family 47 protein [Serendipita vermifera MAFF 305830]
MDEGTGDSLLGWEPRRGVTRKSTLILYLRRVFARWSTRLWTFFILFGLFILYTKNRRPSVTKLGEWKSDLQYKGRTTTNKEWKRRADAVKDAFIEAYNAYESKAFPKDELRPLTGDGVQILNGWGLTAVDALDTMLLMGLHAQANRTIRHVETLDFSGRHKTLFFETTIRYLGGLLSAYHLTKNPILLQKADELGKSLLAAFNTTSGLPVFAIDSGNGDRIPMDWNGGYSLLAEIASCQMEFKYLAYLTDTPIYYETVDRVTSILERQQGPGGLWNTFWNTTDGKQANKHLSIGAWADSGYEYLLKEYLLTGQTDKRLESMYKKSMFGAISQLVFISPNRHMIYITDIRERLVTAQFEHLSCFFPALLALGTHILPNWTQNELELHQMVAHGLAESCWLTYKDSPSGLGPEDVLFNPFLPRDMDSGRFIKHYDAWATTGRKGAGPIGLNPLATPVKSRIFQGVQRDYSIKLPDYKLRPETVEAMYLMWKTTKNPIWRERSWEIFENMLRWTRKDNGFAALSRAWDPQAGSQNSMPSFFLAETLKYLYLSFLDPEEDPWPLDQYVFNTEAHPFPVFAWTGAQQRRWDAVRSSFSL